MSVSDYASLQAAIIDTAMRSGDTDFAAAVPNFITDAEFMMNYGYGDISAIRTRDMETSATVTITGGVGTIPTDYLEYRSVSGNSSVIYPLDPISPDYRIREYPSAAATQAQFFDIVGSTITTSPPSDSNLTLNYFAKIPALSLSNTTNWLLTKAPQIYKYGALIHAAPYMMDDQRAQVWGDLYAKAVTALMQTEKRAKYSRPAARVRGWTP